MNAYPIYAQRQTQILDGIWDFSWLGDSQPWEKIDIKRAVYSTAMAVPGAFDAGPDLAGKRGLGLYRRSVYTGVGAGKMRIRFGGLGLRAKIYWDGREIGATELAYSGVEFDFEAGAGAHHELVVAVDNRVPVMPPILFSPEYDFYGYGGIYRTVELERLPVAHLNRVQVRTINLEKKNVRLSIGVEGIASDDLEFTVTFDGGNPKAYKRCISKDTVILDVVVPRGKVWSPESPNLHTVTVAIAGDCIEERFGLRTIEASKGKIWLNGEPLLLRGFNRHESHPEMGPALSTSIMIEDLQLLRDMGCNFIRGAHYPMNQQFLDLCDQMGFLVWSESLGWQDNEARVTNAHFAELQEAQTRLMVRNGINHPSIIIWAFENEGMSHMEYARPLYTRLIKAIREEDPSRLVSYATCRAVPLESCSPSRVKQHPPLKVYDLFLDMVDVISLNTYPAWINDLNWETIRQFDVVGKRIAELTEYFSQPAYKNKPVIFAEIGAASIPGCHDRLRSGWSEEYQSDICVEAIRQIFSHERLSGVALWQYCDSRTFANGCWKARGFNGAGVVDEYRRPKLAYDAVKREFSELKGREGKKMQPARGKTKSGSSVQRAKIGNTSGKHDQESGLRAVATNSNWR